MLRETLGNPLRASWLNLAQEIQNFCTRTKGEQTRILCSYLNFISPVVTLNRES